MTRPRSAAALQAAGERGLNGFHRRVTERIVTIGALRVGADRDQEPDHAGVAVRRVADVDAGRPGSSRLSRGRVYRDRVDIGLLLGKVGDGANPSRDHGTGYLLNQLCVHPQATGSVPQANEIGSVLRYRTIS